MKTVKVNHVVLTMAVSPAGLGESRDEIDRKINARLAEGYDDVEVFLTKTNFDERQQATDVVMLYVFKKYAEDVPAAQSVKAKKADA